MGLDDGTLSTDLRSMGATSAWLARAGTRTGVRITVGATRLTADAVGTGARATRDLIGRIRKRT